MVKRLDLEPSVRIEIGDAIFSIKYFVLTGEPDSSKDDGPSICLSGSSSATYGLRIVALLHLGRRHILVGVF